MSKEMNNATRTINRLRPEKRGLLYQLLSQSERKGTAYMLALRSISPGLFSGLASGILSIPTVDSGGTFAQRVLMHKYEQAMRGHFYCIEAEERNRILTAYPALGSCLDARSSNCPRPTPEEAMELQVIASAKAKARDAVTAKEKEERDGLPLLHVTRIDDPRLGVLWRGPDETRYVRTPQLGNYNKVVLGATSVRTEVKPVARMAWRDSEDVLYDLEDLKVTREHLCEEARRAEQRNLATARARQIKKESKTDTAYTAAIRSLIYAEYPGYMGRIMACPFKTEIGPANEEDITFLEALLCDRGYDIFRSPTYIYIADPGYEMREHTIRYVRVRALVDYEHREDAKSVGFSWDSDKRIWWRDIPQEELSTTSITYPFSVETVVAASRERTILEVARV